MQVLALVRRHARRRIAPERLRALARPCDDWRQAEGALQAEFERSPARARRLVDAYAAVASAHGGGEARGRAARVAGSYASYLGRQEDALRHYAAATALLRGAARDGARLGTAAALLRLGRFDESRAACRSVRRAARRRGDAVLGAGADLNEAVARHEGGDPAAAIVLYERAASAFAAAGIASLEAAARQNRANALVLLDRHDEAAPELERAAAAFEALGATHDGARCHMNRGGLLAACDRLGDADQALREAETALVDGGDPTETALARLDRADVLLRAGLAEDAAMLCASVRRALRRAPPAERERARLLEARALLLAGRGAEVRSRLRAPAPSGLRRLAAEREELLGRAAALAGRPTAADQLRRAARSFARAGHPVGRARALTAAAWCAATAGERARARRDLGAARRALGTLDLPSADHAIAAVRFMVEADAGRRAAADTALSEALNALERVRDGLGRDAFRAALLRGREAWLARAVRHVLAGPGGAAAALELLERWRARALRDLLGGAARVAAGTDDLDALRSRVARLERRLTSESGPAFLRGTAETGTRDVARSLAAAEGALRDATRLRAEGAAPAPDLAALRAGLPVGTVVLALFTDAEGTLVWALSRDALRLHRVTPAQSGDVTGTIDRLRFHLGQFELGSTFVARHAQRLARRIDGALAALADVAVAPVAAELRTARRVIVIPHGPWHHVPVAALPLDGRPLVAGADVASAPALGALARRSPRARGRSVVVAVADGDAPRIADEGRRVAESLGARLLADDAARLDAIAASRAPPACLHVAAHGRYRADAPAMSGVRIADGWLRAAEFPRLALRGTTVVLSGCETGLSAVHAGDEVQGLVRGVFASGAAELIAGLWRVDDPATAELMVRLHAERSRGRSADAALSAAQRALHAAGAAPWFWAGFQCWTTRA